MAASETDNIIKLSLFAKVKPLKPLPGQERGRAFAVVDSIQPQPEKSIGYLVEVVAPRRVKVLAWMALGGAIFACDAPLATRPERRADGGVTKFDGDKIGFYLDVDGKTAITVHFFQRERDGRLTVTKRLHDLGPYGSGAYDIDEIGAACFLVDRVFPHERGETEPLVTVGDLLDVLVGKTYPDALDELIYRGTREGASGFERYAARSLLDAGAEYVRSIAAANDVDLRRLGSTGLFWTSYSRQDLVDREIDTLQAVEGALNRLVFLERMLAADDGSSPFVSMLDEGDCEDAARAALAGFVSGAETRLQACEEPGPFSVVAGIASARGGEWDTRTRFAAAVEGLRTPFSFDYDFDCDARAGKIAVELVVPASRAFPFEGEDAREEAQRCYALRLVTLIAAVAFGAGSGVVDVVATVRERVLGGRALVSMELARRPFAMEVLPRVASGALLDVELSSDRLLALLSPRTCLVAAPGDLDGVEPIAPSLPERLVRMAEDARPLPPSLAERLRADTARDLDIYDTADDPLRERFRELVAREDAGDPGVLGDLLDMVSAYEAAEALQDSARTPLYCSNMVSRVIVGDVDGDPSARYRKVPDTLFEALAVLCRMNRERGNLEDALEIATDLVRMAPTSFNSHHSLALVYTEMGRMAEAIEEISEGLKVAAAPSDIACGYYRLGYLYWQTGEPSLGLACYALVRRDTFFCREAQREMQDLMHEGRLSRKPTRDEAAAMARAANVPLAPLSSLVESAAAAAVGLTDAGFFDAASMLANFLSTVDVGPNSSDVLSSVARSLRA